MSAPDSRDDLVFAGSKMHIISTILTAPFALNPDSCLLSGTVRQTGKTVGGTGQFAAATGSYAATVKAQVLLARDRDGSCSFRHLARHEADKIAVGGRCRSDAAQRNRRRPAPPGRNDMPILNCGLCPGASGLAGWVLAASQGRRTL